MNRQSWFLAYAVVTVGALSACAEHAAILGPARASVAVAHAAAEAPPLGPLPTGAQGELVAYGRDILRDTRRYAGSYSRAGMSCEACHLAAGTKAHAGSFRGIYATFPQWNKRAKRFIALQDRLAECFLYSMNGTPPAYASREMVALTAYIAYLSQGAPVGTGFANQGFANFAAPGPPNVAHGATVYGTRCAACHGADGRGVGTYPPLWGAASFNNGAGMHRLTTMAAFVRYNMPYGGPPNALTKQDAYDVAAFVLKHPRPHFDATRLVVFPARRANTF